MAYSFFNRQSDTKENRFLRPEESYGPQQPRTTFMSNDTFGPDLSQYKTSIFNTYSGTKVNQRDYELLRGDEDKGTQLAGRGLIQFAKGALSFGVFGGGSGKDRTFTESDLTARETAAYSVIANIENANKAEYNSAVYRQRTKLNEKRAELKAIKDPTQSDLKQLAEVEKGLKSSKYDYGKINYASYENIEDKALARELKLFTGRASVEKISIGDKQAFRITDEYDFKAKSDSVILNFAYELRAMQQQGVTVDRLAIAGLTAFSNMAAKYSGGSSNYGVDIIVGKDGIALTKEEIEKYREENHKEFEQPTLGDKLWGATQLAMDTSGIGFAAGAAYAMKKQGFMKAQNKYAKSAVLLGALVAPLVMSAAVDSFKVEKADDINVFNFFTEGAVSNTEKIGNGIGTVLSNIGSFFSDMFKGDPDKTSNVATKTQSSGPSLSSRLNELKKAPWYIKKAYKEAGVKDNELARNLTLGTEALIATAAVGGFAIAGKHAYKRFAKNGMEAAEVVTKASLGRQALLKRSAGAALVLGGIGILAGIFAKDADSAEVPLVLAGMGGISESREKRKQQISRKPQATDKPESSSAYYTNKQITTTKKSVKVTDADSFLLFADDYQGPTRLYGVDAPETSIYEKDGAKTVKERTNVKKQYLESKKEKGLKPDLMYEISQDYGPEATGVARDFINQATEVHVSLKQMDAKGGRRVVEVHNQDGESLATHLVKEGAAFAALPFDSTFDGTEESFERYELMKQAYRERKGLFAKDDFVLPSSFRKNKLQDHYKHVLDVAIKSDEFKHRGLGNNQYAYILADDNTYFTLPASMGASSFHGANLEHNLMEQNNYQNLASETDYKGLAESLMSYNAYMLKGETLNSLETFMARAYDSGLQAGGVGNWLNREIFIPRGWGRVYKDEKGAVASIAGLAGKILDEGYMYYANLNPDWVLIGQDYQSGLGYGSLENPQQGIFQTTFENMAGFAESMAQSLGMYLAITAPIELLSAGYAQNALEQSIKGTLIDNTALSAVNKFDTIDGIRRGGGIWSFASQFMAEFYFGETGIRAAMKPGGLTAAVLKERFALDEVDNYGKRKAFYDHNDGPRTGYHAMQIIARGRARNVLEGTFKPFLIDLVNPFDETAKPDREIRTATGRRAGNAYDEFNMKVNKLIDVIAQPVDLHFRITAGETYQVGSVVVQAGISDAKDSIAAANHKGGGLEVKVNGTTESVQTIGRLKELYQKNASDIHKQAVANNEELYEILTKNGFNEQEAKEIIYNGGKTKSGRTWKDGSYTHKNVRNQVETHIKRQAIYAEARGQLESQLGNVASKLEVTTTGSGMNYKTQVAAALQDILNMIPLNPLKWGMVNRSAQHADEFLSIGQLFSFQHAAEFTKEVLTGQNSISNIFAQFEPTVPDPVDGGKMLTKAQHMSNVAKSRIYSADRILGEAWKSIKSFFSGAPKSEGDLAYHTERMRKAEREIVIAERNSSKVKAVQAGKSASEADNAWRNAKGFYKTTTNDAIDAADNVTQLKVADVDEAANLLDEILDYSHAVRQGALSGVEGAKKLSKAITDSSLTNLTDEIYNVADKFSGNIKGEKFLKGATGYIAATIFASMALNNILQSTQGVSIAAQLGLALYGEDEDIAVKFEGNRFLPTEYIAAAIPGLDQTAVNLVADAVLIGSTYGIGHHIAKNIKRGGYLPYTFDAEMISKLAEADGYEIVNKAGKRMMAEDLDKIEPAAADNFVVLKKTVGNAVKETILTKTALANGKFGFRSEAILQEFAEDVPTKAFIFGSIALLAVEGLRNTAGTLLQAMAESPDDKNYFGIMAGMVGLGFIGGAGFDRTYRPHIDSSEEVLKAGGEVASKIHMNSLFKTNAMRWAIGGAALGGAIYVAKLVLDPKIKEKGSLDPLVAGAAFGIGTALFKNSITLGGIVGLAAATTMAAVNWAGIRILEIGRAGAEVDPHTSKLVAQLSQFSTAVLEKEKDSVSFNLMMAAYASQFSAGKSIIAADPKAVAGDVQVIAKQAPMPFLQFFVAERVKGPRGENFSASMDTESTVRTYSLGIQSGALFGTSLSVELPVSYTPGQGFFGFTYNSQNNLMSVPNFAIKVGVWAAAMMGTVGIGYQFGAALNQTAYNLTGFKGFEVGARNFTNHAEDLFNGARMVLNAAEKISTFFIRQTVGIFTTLQGTDIKMAYDLINNDTDKVVDASNKLEGFSHDELTKATNSNIDTLDDISASKNIYSKINSTSAIGYARRGKHLFVGALLGAIAGGLIHDVVKDRELASHYEAGESYETLIKVEDQIDRREAIYVVAGGVLGAIGNDLRVSRGLIKNAAETAANKLTYKLLRRSKAARSTAHVMRKFAQGIETRKSEVLNNKIINGIVKNTKGFFSNKFGAYGSVFLAAMAFNYIKTNSEFGITTMMDRYIVYDKYGNAYKDYEQQTTKAPLHQFAVAASMSTIQTGIIGLAAMPHLSQRETMLGVVKRKLENVSDKKNMSFFQKMRRTAGNLIMGVHHWRSERETGRLLENLLSLDEEFEIYKAAKEAAAAKGAGAKPILDPKIQKIEDVLKLREHLDKEELKEFIALDKKVKTNISLDKQEMDTYKKFLGKASAFLEQGDNLAHLSRGFRQTAKFRSFSIRASAVLFIATVGKAGFTHLLNQGGEVGTDSYLDRLYIRANGGGKFGQIGPDGKKGSFMDGVYNVAADVARLITNRDVVDINYAVDALNGKMVKTTGQRLVSNSQGLKDAQRTIKDLSEMLIFDNPNAYIATFDFGGRTFRHGDKGVTTSTYFQLQSPGQDISTASYSMAAKFIFNQYTAGKGRLATIVDRGMRDFDPNDPASFAKAALAIRNATGMLHAMQTSRKYSAATAETAAMFMGDSVAAAIIAKRQEALAHQAWQSVDSLFTNMFFETIDKAKHRGQDEAVLKFFEGIARNEGEVLKIFSDLMAGGVFETFFRRTAITNVQFFSGSFGKPPKQSGPEIMSAEISALWYATHDISVQTEMFKQSRVEVLDNFIEKTAKPMWNHGVLAIIPDIFKIGGLATVTLGLSAYIAMSLAQYTQTKTFQQQTGEMLEVFGRKEPIAGPKIELAPADTEQIIQQLKENLAEGKKTNFSATKQTSRALIIKADPVTGNVVETATNVGEQSRNIGVLRVSQVGKTKAIHFSLSRYLNLLDDGQLQDFVTTLEAKGDQIRNMFEFTDANKVRKSIAVALTNEADISDWLYNKLGLKNENLYSVFNGTHTTVSKATFINATVEDFTSKFEQGLDKMYDTFEDLNSAGNHHLFEVVEIKVDGQTKKIMKGELLYPEDGLDLDGDLTNRAEALKSRLQSHKQAFLDEVKEIVEAEMHEVKFPGNNPTPAQQAAELQQARVRALHRIKTKLEDPSSAIGAAARGAGIVKPETMLEQADAKSAAQAAQGIKVKHQTTDDVVRFFDDAIDTLHYSTPRGHVGIFDSLGAVGKTATNVFGTSFDVLTGIDTLSAYMRTAETLQNPFATDLDKQMAEKELGQAIMSSIVGLAFGFGVGKLGKLLDPDKLKTFLTVKKVAMGTGILTVAALVGGMLNKTLIQPAVKKFTRYSEDNKIGAKIKSAWDNAWHSTSDIVGHLAAAPVNFAYKTGGKKAAYGMAGFLGGTAAGAIVGIGAIGAVKLGAAAIGGAAGTIGAAPLLIFSLGVGIVAGVGAIFFGDKITSGLNYGIREFQKVPLIGQMVGLTDPYREIRNQERFKHYFVNSPFLLGYAGDIVNSNWMATLAASEDFTGRDQVANLFGEVLSEGEGYGETNPAWRVQAADGLIGGPKPLIDEVIQQELRIRAEFYSDNVIGRYTWDQMVKYSDNSNTIRAMEAQKRAERIRIQEAARVRLIKTALEAGGPTQALKANNPRTAAVTGVAAARVEQVYRDLDTDTASVKVTAATISTHKSNTKNSDQKQADQTKASAVSQYGAGVAPITKDHIYKGRIYIDKTTATVDFSKEQSDMNPILTIEAQAVGANKSRSAETQSQVTAYNSHKNES